MAERLFGDIERRFEAEHGASRLSRRFQKWRSEHLPLEPFKSIDDLLGFFRDRSILYAPKDEIAGILCALSPDDELAKLLLLKLYIPGLIAKRRALFGRGLAQDELDATLVAGFLDRAAKTHLGTEMLSGRLLAAARGRLEREIKKTAKSLAREAPTPVDPVTASARAAAEAAEEAMSKVAAAELITKALTHGVLNKEQAAVLWAVDVEGLSSKDAAAKFSITDGAARVRLHRARGRLGRWGSRGRPDLLR